MVTVEIELITPAGLSATHNRLKRGVSGAGAVQLPLIWENRRGGHSSIYILAAVVDPHEGKGLRIVMENYDDTYSVNSKATGTRVPYRHGVHSVDETRPGPC